MDLNEVLVAMGLLGGVWGGIALQSRYLRGQLEKQVAAAEERLKERVSFSERAIKAHVDQQLLASEKRNEARHNALEARLDASEKRNEARHNALEARLDASEKLNGAQHAALEAKLDAVGEDAKQAADGVAALSKDVSRLEGYTQRGIVEAFRKAGDSSPQA